MGGMDYDWLSTKQAAERIGVLPRTLYAMIDRGELTAFRFGRVIRLKEEDVDAMIADSKIEPGSLGHLHGVPQDDSA